MDGQSRLRILRRSRNSVFASIRQGKRVVAVGLACISHGWCGIHGMRTAPDARAGFEAAWVCDYWQRRAS